MRFVELDPSICHEFHTGPLLEHESSGLDKYDEYVESPRNAFDIEIVDQVSTERCPELNRVRTESCHRSARSNGKSLLKLPNTTHQPQKSASLSISWHFWLKSCWDEF